MVHHVRAITVVCDRTAAPSRWAEREPYLQHCSDSGATYWSLRIKCNELLWAAKLLDLDAKNGVDMEKLESIADRRIAFQFLRGI
jgi:hypothetical protein